MFSYNAKVKDCLLKNGFVIKPMYFNKPRDGDVYKVDLAEEMRLIEENNRLFEERVKPNFVGADNVRRDRIPATIDEYDEKEDY